MKTIRIALPENKQNVTNYLNVLRAFGTETVVVSNSSVHRGSACQQEYLDITDLRPENYDGLIIPGGMDIAPSRFGQEWNGSRRVDEELDALQFEALDRFVRAKKPIFGICRGYQLINVYFGGSLIQDLPTKAVHEIRFSDGPDKLHRVKAKKGSWIEELYGTEFVFNSAHHQASDRLGEGLQVDAVCVEDQVPEALHHTKLPIWSLQGHPERMCLSFFREEGVDGLEVFRFFLEKCLMLSGTEAGETAIEWNI